MKKIKVSGMLCLLFILFSFNVPANASDWTVMVYMDADNNLESNGIDDFLEMASVGSDENVNIVVQFDRTPGEAYGFGDWSDCNRFVVTPGMKPFEQSAVSDWGDGMGGREVNMADPETVIDFALWAMKNYPADRYAFVFWNHGDGWRSEMEPLPPPLKAVCWDDTSEGDALVMQEVQYALSEIRDRSTSLDVIGFDACLMGMVEIAHEIRNCGDVMVGAEETVPGDGWPYRMILSDLTAFPAMTAIDFGDTIVKRYGQSYTFADDTTMAAIDLSRIRSLSDALDNLAEVMMDGNKTEIQAARASVQEYYVPEHIDIGHFSNLLTVTGNSEISLAAESVTHALSDIIISEYHDLSNPQSNGLAIYFPESPNSLDTDYNASVIDFAADTLWDDFLRWYHEDEESSIILVTPADRAVLPADPETTFSWQGEADYRYKIQFSAQQPSLASSTTLTLPRKFWMTGTSTDTIHPVAWQKAWNRIIIMAQRNGTVYWRVVGKDTGTNSIESSEVRSFTIEK